MKYFVRFTGGYGIVLSVNRFPQVGRKHLLEHFEVGLGSMKMLLNLF